MPAPTHRRSNRRIAGLVLRAATVFAMCSVSVTSTVAQKPPSLTARLDAEFKNRQFVTKTSLWNVLRVTEGGNNHPMLVDTELYPNKTKRAELRATSANSPADIAPDFIPNVRGFLHSLPEGARVVVTRVDPKDDRLELWLRSVPGGAYAKLKFMFGKGWQKTLSFDEAVGQIAEGLVIERVERRRSLEAEYRRLEAQLTVARTGIQNASSTTTQFEQTRGLRDSVQALLKNRAEYEQLTGISTRRETEKHSSELADIEPRFATLEQQVRRDQLINAKATVTELSKDAAAFKNQITQSPRTTADADRHQQILKQWEGTIQRRRELLRTIASLGEALPAAAQTTLSEEADEIQKRRAALAQGRGALVEAGLTAEYRDMERERSRLLDAYTRSFGTPKQREAVIQLTAHLQRMYDNRMAAQKLGSKTAATQAAEVQRLIDRVRRQ
jgi:hypothetical protein